jgi:REP element-mobilizing transposase RayT
MNRGIARRPVFQNAFEIRNFLSRVARAVRRGELELSAFAVLPTHFHLLVRSPVGRLSRTMGWIELGYVRWFNRRHRRDGPLFRGRFLSKPIDSDRYRETVLHYIHENPVHAGLAPNAADYPWCSASTDRTRTLAPRAPRTRWRRIESIPSLGSRPERTADRAWIVERTFDVSRRRLRRVESTPLEDLVGGAPTRVLAWMRRKTRLADGGECAEPVLAPRNVVAAIDRHASLDPAWRESMLAGLLRLCCGLRLKEIARQLARSESTAGDRIASHAVHLETDEHYATEAAAIVACAIRERFDP